MLAKNCHLFFCYHYHYKEKQGDVNIENKKVTLGSLFDGIGIFPFAASHYGIEPVWASEIDKNAIAVTKRHFPKMKHLGNIKKIDVRKTEPVDIIAFGSPCQNLSLIGDRTGIKGVKSSLFFETIRIINEMRDYTNGLYPTFAVWENVAGSLVSGGRNDFRAILEAFTGSAVPMPHTKWANAGMVRRSELELCWRVLDAQHFGTPKLLQRRKRVFIVCDFRKRSACKILYKPRHIKEDTKTFDKGGGTASKSNRKDTSKTGGTDTEQPNGEKLINSTYSIEIYADGNKNMVITKNPTMSAGFTKSAYEPKPKENIAVDNDKQAEILEFLETFFTLYPKATDKELSYYVKGNVLKPIGKDYIFSELINPVLYQEENGSISVSLAVKYLDEDTKMIQVFQYEFVLVKENNWIIIK